MRSCRLAVFGFLGGAFRTGNDLPPSRMPICRRAACIAACNLSDEDSSRGQNTCCGSQQQEAGVTPEARRDRAALSRTGGVAPASLRVLAASDSCSLSSPSGSFLSCLRLRLGDVRGEISGERFLSRTFPRSFHPTIRMPLEKGHLAVHRSENERHRLWSSERLVFLSNLIEVHLLGTPSLVEIRDLRAIELDFPFLESDQIRLR